jgi:hypothetical protein
VGGKFSRNKGRRNEQQLVLYLARHGYQAERILRQYQEAGQPDVKAVKNGKTTTFEMKARKCSFKTIYALYDANKGVDDIFCFSLVNNPNLVAMSTSLSQLTDTQICDFRFTTVAGGCSKTYNRVINLSLLKQGADYLVIKDNNKPMLFLRFW